MDDRDKDLKVFKVEGMYHDEIDDYKLPVLMNIINKTEEGALEVFDKYLLRADVFERDEIYGCYEERTRKRTTVSGRAEELVPGNKEQKFSYIMWLPGEYNMSGTGTWDEVFEEINNNIDGDFGEFVEISIDFNGPSGITGITLYRENPYYSQDTQDAIKSCIRRGIDPFGA